MAALPAVVLKATSYAYSTLVECSTLMTLGFYTRSALVSQPFFPFQLESKSLAPVPNQCWKAFRCPPASEVAPAKAKGATLGPIAWEWLHMISLFVVVSTHTPSQKCIGLEKEICEGKSKKFFFFW